MRARLLPSESFELQACLYGFELELKRFFVVIVIILMFVIIAGFDGRPFGAARSSLRGR